MLIDGKKKIGQKAIGIYYGHNACFDPFYDNL